MLLTDSETFDRVYSALCAARDKGGEVTQVHHHRPMGIDPEDPGRISQTGDETLTFTLRIPRSVSP